MSGRRSIAEDIWELESDLPSLASHAAVELDNLILNRAQHLEAVRRLANMILGSFIPAGKGEAKQSAFDPTVVVLMNRAIADSGLPDRNLRTVDELVKRADQIGEVLKRVSEHPREFRERDEEFLAQMRDFCVALSSRASARDLLFEEAEQPHPYRR